MTLPFYGKKMKQEGIKLDNLKLVKHFHVPSEKDFKLICDFILDCESIVDVGAGYGLIIKSLSKIFPKKQFKGIDTLYWKENKFPIPKETNNLKFEFNGIQAMAYSEQRGFPIIKYDCVICCWMPHGDDWTEMLSMISNKKIILILSKDFATGTPDSYFRLGKLGFKLIKAQNSLHSLIQLWEKDEVEVLHQSK